MGVIKKIVIVAICVFSVAASLLGVHIKRKRKNA